MTHNQVTYLLLGICIGLLVALIIGEIKDRIRYRRERMDAENNMLRVVDPQGTLERMLEEIDGDDGEEVFYKATDVHKTIAGCLANLDRRNKNDRITAEAICGLGMAVSLLPEYTDSEDDDENTEEETEE